MTLGESLGLGLSMWTKGPCPALSTAGGHGSLQEKDGVSVGQDGPSAATHPSSLGLRQLQPEKKKKKKPKKTIVLSTHPESKHSVSRVHLTQLGGPALRELTVRASTGPGRSPI